MKKKLMTAAVAAALAVPTLASAAVDVYGLLDIGIQNVKPGTGYAGAKSFINDAQGSGGTRLGFRGTDDIGGGLKGVFVYELGARPDTGALDNASTSTPTTTPAPTVANHTHTDTAVQLFQRQIYGGLTGGFGSATLGRQYTEEFLVAASGDYNIAAALISPYGLENKTTRVSNSFKYSSPPLGPVVIAATIGLGAEGTTAATADDGKYADLAAKAALGPVKVGLAVSKTTVTTTPEAENKDTTLGGNWNFGMGTLYFVYTTDKTTTAGATTGDQTLMSLGAAFKLGGGDLVVQLARVDDKTATNNDARLTAVAYYYNLSKATTVYASYGKLNNNATGTRIMTGQAAFSGPAGSAPGDDPSALVAGWKIAF